MQAGFGIRDITPPAGAELAGYGYYLKRVWTSVRDPLHVRAAVIETQETRCLIVSCELLGLDQATTDAVRAYGTARGCDAVMIVSVHTHTGPAIKYHEGCGACCPTYVAHLRESLCAAAEDAFMDRAEVTSISYGRSDVDGDWIYNRANPDGPVDRCVRGFVLSRRDHRPLALMGVACHGVFLGRVSSVSADFSGEIIRNLGDMDVVYLNGLCGDIDPYKPNEEHMVHYGAVVAETFRTALRSIPMTLSCRTLPFELHLMPVSRDTITATADLAVRKAGGEEVGAARVARAWQKEMLEQFDSLQTREPGEAVSFTLGGVPIIALPFEGFTAIGQRIREGLESCDALVLGCADELRGYLPTRDDFERGAYAALESTFLYRRLPALPGEAERLAEQIIAAYLPQQG